MATNIQSLLCGGNRLTSVSEQLTKLEQVSQAAGAGLLLLLWLITCDAESWGAHLRLLMQPCRGPAQNCSHSKQANPIRLIETKPEILVGVDTSTRRQGKAVRISCFLSVLLTGSAVAFFRTFLRRIKSWTCYEIPVARQRWILVKASVKIIWTTLRSIHKCIGAQVLEETVLS